MTKTELNPFTIIELITAKCQAKGIQVAKGGQSTTMTTAVEYGLPCCPLPQSLLSESHTQKVNSSLQKNNENIATHVVNMIEERQFKKVVLACDLEHLQEGGHRLRVEFGKGGQ